MGLITETNKVFSKKKRTTMKDIKQWCIFNILKKVTVNSEPYGQKKKSFKTENEIKGTFPN